MTPDAAVVELPTSREEAWRYTPTEEVRARFERATVATREARSLPDRSLVDDLAGNVGGARMVFVNGTYAAELSDDQGLPSGLWCGPAGPDHPAVVRALAADQGPTPDGFLIHNHTDHLESAVVVVDAGVRLDDPVHVVHVTMPEGPDADPAMVLHPRTIVEVGDGGHLTVVETYCGIDGPTVTNASSTIRTGAHAEVDHCRIQVESSSATHIGHTRVEQGEGSRVAMASITVGGDIARNAIDVHLDAPDARTELTGVNVTNGHQRHDTVVTVEHTASRCASNQRFAGVVDDHGRGSFSGEIVVHPGTVATDAHQTNRNLVLDPHAEADTRPWLRILADDVRCTHGATVGRLDDEALFYLRSRGIGVAEARTMLIDAFVTEVTETITNDSVRAHVAAVVAVRKTPVAAITGTEKLA